jgi:GNAT superfamily N-acetyltransferase
MPDTITYALEPAVPVVEFTDVLRRSTLGLRRPLDRPDVIAKMIANAQLILTARDRRAGNLLVGVARALTDFAFCTYLSDLAVDQAYQRRGIGRQLLRRTHDAAGRDTTLILIAAPDARTYYGHIGMTSHDSAWVTWRDPDAEPSP